MTDKQKQRPDWQKNFFIRWLVRLGFFLEFHVPFFGSLLAIVFFLGLLNIPGFYEFVGLGDADPIWVMGGNFLVVFFIPFAACIALCWWGFRYLLFHINFRRSIPIFLLFNLILLCFFQPVFYYTLINQWVFLLLFYGLLFPATIAFLIAMVIDVAIKSH